MRYPIAIEIGDGTHAHGVVVPDLPGCFSAGDTLDEALANAKQAIEMHLEDYAERRTEIPEARTIEDHYRNPDYAACAWAVVSVDDSQYRDKAVRLNITLPQRLLETIDASAASAGYSRSGLLAEAARNWVDGRYTSVHPTRAKAVATAKKRAGILAPSAHFEPEDDHGILPDSDQVPARKRA